MKVGDKVTVIKTISCNELGQYGYIPLNSAREGIIKSKNNGFRLASNLQTYDVEIKIPGSLGRIWHVMGLIDESCIVEEDLFI